MRHRLIYHALITFHAMIMALAVFYVVPVSATELRILTSMPLSFFEPFSTAFERQNPDISVIVLNKNTNAAVEEIVRGNQRAFDIFWASSTEAFAVLDAHKAFRPAVKSLTRWPGENPHDAAYYTFALSSIGWAQNSEMGLSEPRQWNDLLRPIYAGHIGMARPSRSGTTHMFVERFLQVRGWNEGWRYLLALGGNLSTLTSRSFGVIDGLENRRFDIGITIDFLAQSRREKGLKFSYGIPVMIMPAQIGLLRGGHSEAAGAQFLRFVLSDEGQRLLLSPDIRRIPISENVRTIGRAQIREISDALRLSWQPYDALLARDRYWAVNALFDEFVTFQLEARREAWARLRHLQSLKKQGYSVRLTQVERLLTTMPIREAQASTAPLNETPTRVTAFTAPTNEQQAALLVWTQAAEQILSDVQVLLDDVEQQMALQQ